MPPKKKQKTTKALPAPCEDEDQSEPDLGPSKAHWIKVHDALARIFSHELFKDILTADPLSVKDGGREAALDATQAASALKNAGVYKCAAIFFHQDFLFMATHKVPTNEAQVQQIKDYWFPKNEPPSLCPFVITVALETPGCIGQRPQNGFQRLSPPEPVHALLFALAEAIESKAKVGVLRAFRSCILTATFVFEICPVGEDRYWRAQNIREEMVEKGLSVQLSLRQRIFDIAGFYEAKKKLSQAWVPKSWQLCTHSISNLRRIKRKFRKALSIVLCPSIADFSASPGVKQFWNGVTKTGSLRLLGNQFTPCKHCLTEEARLR